MGKTWRSFVLTPVGINSKGMKKNKINNIALLLKGALNAEGKVGLKMNVLSASGKKQSYANVTKIFLDMGINPTVSQLAEGGGYDIDVIMEEKKVRDLIPLLKKAGADLTSNEPFDNSILNSPTLSLKSILFTKNLFSLFINT